MTTAITRDMYSLSPVQEGYLFHYLYGGDASVDIEQVVCTLREDLDAAALKRAWEHVVARHPSLRISLQWESLDVPLQVVHQVVDIPFEVADWRGTFDVEERLQAHLRSDRLRGVELSQAPLMRLALIRIADCDYRLIWTFHHMVTDGRSRFVVLQEVFSYYGAFRTGQELQLDQPRLYRDHIQWLQGQDPSAAEAFWRQVLKGFVTPTPLAFPPAAVAPSSEDELLGEAEIRLSEETTSALRAMAEKHNLSLSTLVQGAWAILLSRYSGEQDVVFGAVRAGRRSSGAGFDATVGVFINTLPVRVRVSPDRPLLPWLLELREYNLALRPYEHTPLVKVQVWSERASNTPLFESVLVYDYYPMDTALRAQGGEWENRSFRSIENTGYPITINAYGEPVVLLQASYDRQRFDDAGMERMLGHLATVLDSMAQDPLQELSRLQLLTAAEAQKILVDWNETAVDFDREKCIHHLFEAQVDRGPDEVAVVAEGRELSYAQLNARANQLAHHLRKLGVGPDALVGVFLDRSLDMMVTLLGILKAGGAYVPLDPTYPKERLAFMLEDSRVAVLLTRQALVQLLPAHQARVVCVDTDWPVISNEPENNLEGGASPDNLAYVIYTSGSTGKPKGVMVRHGNVVNFFAGMDLVIPRLDSQVWLAVTSLSFDISVLELFWTLARGFKVVLHGAQFRHQPGLDAEGKAAQIDFSLFYFASDEGEQGVADKYRLLLEGARFADRRGFAAIWTPERHFHAFGGLYPNPAVTGAAVAAITERLRIRAGSVVLPLHNPIRVAEEWAVVDNLSQGRVGISFASGWHPRDFVLQPENYERRKEIMFRDIETVRRLWRGETLTVTAPDGKEVEVTTLPRPVQPDLPIWITAAGNPETFHAAGEGGFNILTHLLGQSVEELAEKLVAYRQGWAEKGHPGQGSVTLMLHTFVGEDDDAVREIVRAPMKEYLRSSVGLIRQAAWNFPVVKQRAADAGKTPAEVFDSQELTEAEMDALLDHAFERYFETSGLFGTPSTCLAMVNRLKAIGVDEIACLIDFGVKSDLVLSHLDRLAELRELAVSSSLRSGTEVSMGDQIRRYGVTHLQCTPSMAAMLLMDDDTRQAMGQLQVMMVGGEAFPVALANELRSVVPGQIINMYGPTETTVWSSTYALQGGENIIPIGRPIANTEFYILDAHLQPVPIGMAGELYIGGKGVVRGYLDRPELTRERFIENPFRNGSHAPLYRTGDLARFRPDGEVEFLGRTDFQVKIRGHRIELGEIETQLDRHPGVQKSVVVAQELAPGDQRLVAYLIADPHREPAISELRKHLSEALPEFMVPSHFVILDKLPMTPNGKVDRKRLPAVGQVQVETETAYVNPRSDLERTIAAIWQELLNVPSVGVHHNFFELGGHSLLAVQAHRRLRDVVDRDMSVADIFRYPTIRSLAEYLSGAGQTPSVLGAKSTERADARRDALLQRRQRRQQART